MDEKTVDSFIISGQFYREARVPMITQAEEINEKEHTDIQVNGSLGVDRERMEEINESSEDWPM